MESQSEKGDRLLPGKLISFTLNSSEKVASIFVNLKISPNTLSTLALLSGLGAGVLFACEQPSWAVLLIIICGLFDILDGKVAKRTNRKSLFGAIYDSTLDRYSEFFIYLGLAVHFRFHWAIWIIFFTFLGATMVSYTRARAEGLGIECRIGIMQRAERMVLLSLGVIVGSIFKVFDPVIIGVLLIIAVISNITAFQRAFYVKKIENLRKQEKEV